MKYFNIRKDILATLAYFNMFDYPLKKNEIFLYLGHCNDYREFEQALTNLLKDQAVYKMADFYSLQNDSKLPIRRFKGNELATRPNTTEDNRWGQTSNAKIQGTQSTRRTRCWSDAEPR